MKIHLKTWVKEGNMTKINNLLILSLIINIQKRKSYFNTLAGIIWDSGAASINDCHVLVELGITKPKSKNHSGN